jgi:hypothetical protein
LTSRIHTRAGTRMQSCNGSGSEILNWQVRTMALLTANPSSDLSCRVPSEDGNSGWAALQAAPGDRGLIRRKPGDHQRGDLRDRHRDALAADRARGTVLASAPSRTGPCWAASHRATVTAWRGLAIPQVTPGGAWWDTAVRLSPSTVVPASKIRSGNGTSAGIQARCGTGPRPAIATPRDRAVISGPLPQVSRTDKPVSLGGLPERLGRAEIDFPQQDQTRFERTQQLALKPGFGDAAVVQIPRHHSHNRILPECTLRRR